MPWLIGLLAAFSAGAAFAYHRWRFKGVACFAAAAVAVDLIQGTVIWMIPHEELWNYRPWDWPCHATVVSVPLLVLAVALFVALYATRDLVVTLAGRMVVAGMVSALLAFPLVFVMLWWGVSVLSCDTL
ncbi:hypothetical protein [Longimicrobium terrae]|uniref:Uncharacterized protein n=1 Tax=Longimicrobium terrae TaxID=1639882 RepID=A0A841GWR9_9BACT|nr:hypothetical protein [Longimicrobium terrae]MBB4635332.1 hypothetical protein [Longimicrobium terrae]MBB6069725.1 hypothetical protein [Longimicrobium terrae]NNC31064.1 hypothetical protein [Longimicrobium terrae]